MSCSTPASQPDSIDLAYDMWAGQFEFVGPVEQNNNNNNSNNNSKTILNNNNVKFGSDRNASHKQSTESLEDLNLNFITSTSTTAQPDIQLNSSAISYKLGSIGCGGGGGGVGDYIGGFGKQPILIDQETFLSLNPCDFDDIVPSEPNSLVYIDNKLSASVGDGENHLNHNHNNNKIVNFETLTSKLNNCNKTNNTNTNGYKLEHLKNFKNKLICDFDETTPATTTTVTTINPATTTTYTSDNNKMNGLSAEICETLNEQLELLQRQVTDLAGDDRTTRAKTDYAVLQARYHMLEEQFRESELRSEERLAEEQKLHRELLARVEREAEREAELQSENCQIKIKTIEIEANALRDEAQRLRVLCDKQASDLHRTEEKLELARDQIVVLQQELDESKQRERKYEQEKKAAEDLMVELSKELERLRTESGPGLPTTSPETIRLEELHKELEDMRQRNKSLEEQNEELQAAVLTRGVEEGRHLLNGTLNSLAQELEEMSQAQDSVDSATLASLSQLQQAYQEKEDENTRLKHYIDTILLNIVENYPQLLEVKPVQRN